MLSSPFDSSCQRTERLARGLASPALPAANHDIWRSAFPGKAVRMAWNLAGSAEPIMSTRAPLPAAKSAFDATRQGLPTVPSIALHGLQPLRNELRAHCAADFDRLANGPCHHLQVHCQCPAVYLEIHGVLPKSIFWLIGYVSSLNFAAATSISPPLAAGTTGAVAPSVLVARTASGDPTHASTLLRL
jgi:hypothetical protein